eukprot:7391635-Prymnesium_polylepis.2
MSNAVPLDQFICKNVVAEGLSVRSCIINSPLLVEDRSLQNLLAHLLHAKPTALVRLDESNHWLVLLGRGDQFTDTIAGVKISVRAVDEDAVARVDVALKVAYLLKVIDVCKQRKQTTVAYNCQAAGVQDPVTVPSQTQIFGIISRSPAAKKARHVRFNYWLALSCPPDVRPASDRSAGGVDHLSMISSLHEIV